MGMPLNEETKTHQVYNKIVKSSSSEANMKNLLKEHIIYQLKNCEISKKFGNVYQFSLLIHLL